MALAAMALAGCSSSSGGGETTGGTSEADLQLSSTWAKVHGIAGNHVLMIGFIVCILGLVFGFITYTRLKKLPVHQSMKDISELIYSTCKTYLARQIRFLLALWVIIAIVMVIYFKAAADKPWGNVVIIVVASLVGMAGSAAVAAFGMRINTFANSRTAHAALRGKSWPVHQIPMQSGMSVGMVLISLELLLMLVILVLLPGDVAGNCFIGFAIGESLGAAALRIAGGLFTKIADVGADLMKIVFKIDEDDPRNPGTIADCTGDNAGDSVGPTADGFETYGVTGVALVTFILLAVSTPSLQSLLLVWVFTVRAVMLIASAISYFINEAVCKARYKDAKDLDFEKPLTTLVWITSILSIALTFLTTWWVLGEYGQGAEGVHGLWWKCAIIVSCGTLAGAIIPELVKAFTSTKAKHVQEVVKSAREGGASLNILSGLVSGNFSGYWLGIVIAALMGVSYLVSNSINPGHGVTLMTAPAIFGFGLVAFGFLGMGPVTIAVDSYGPVTDNAQSVYELSQIEQIKDIDEELKNDFGFEPDWDNAKQMLEENDGAGNTFKATAKPVLIGTAVTGATTMIFSIIMMLTNGMTTNMDKLAITHPPFLLGLILGGAVIYWFTGASMQAVTTGSYRAVEFIKTHIHLDKSGTRASEADSRSVVGICTKYAQEGMIQIFLAIFFAALAFSFADPYLFIGYLISIAVFGLFQAIFMANAGGAWDNAKKIVEVDLHEKGTDLHDATIVGDTVGDPFKDTSSVAMNPVIKFTTLFGLLAVELAVTITNHTLVEILAAVFFLISAVFVWRSFYSMRIGASADAVKAKEPAKAAK
ncbi:MAG: sodium-translocating pyrophosphatase [Bifidobacteriaceae bacterium]|nr:sodium-translocating pyrophosphatase [Bifidobacteriaceae bacterium]